MLRLFRCFAGIAFVFVAIPSNTRAGILFQEARVFTVDCPAGLGQVLAGDWNGDGKTDLAALCVQNQNLLIFEGDGGGGFRPAAPLPLGGRPHPNQIAAVDLNSDGRTDLLVHYCSDEMEAPSCFPIGEFSAFLSEGDFRFAPPLKFRPAVSTAHGPPGGPYILGFLVEDLNRDGNPDLLLILNSVGRDSVLLGRGDGTFADPIPGPRTFTAIGVSDFNSDGVPDVLTAEIYRTGRLEIHYGRGDGTFDDPVIAIDLSSGICAATGDVDGDGRTELLVENCASWDGTVSGLRVFRGDGQGNFELAAKLPDSLAGDGRQGFAFTFADLNADSRPERAHHPHPNRY